MTVRREQLYSDAFSELASPDVGGCGCKILYTHVLAPTNLEIFQGEANQNFHGVGLELTIERGLTQGANSFPGGKVSLCPPLEKYLNHFYTLGFPHLLIEFLLH